MVGDPSTRDVMDFYDSKAEQYERYMRMGLLTRLYNRFKKRVLNSAKFYLNLGSGLSHGLDTEGRTSVCVDVSRRNLQLSKRYSRNSLFVAADATKIPFKHSSFTSIVSFDLLEHISDKDRLVSEVFRILKPGGRLTLTTPNHSMGPIIGILDRLRLKFPEGPHWYSKAYDFKKLFRRFRNLKVSKFFFNTQFLVRVVK